MINQELTEQEREIMGHRDVKPRAAISGCDCKSSPISGDNPDFGFAFNDSNYSDRILRIEIVSAGDNKTAKSGESNWSEDGSKVLKVETLHISSPILAAKSHFFRKLFSNGMMESKERCATLRINESEEAALMELLHFMYCNTLTSSTTPALLDVLMVADKFEVASCMTHCSLSLEALPMTVESALLYLDLPPTIQTNDAIQCLTDAAKQLLALCYKDIPKYQDEVLKLPLAGFEAVLSSNDLQVTSEDEVYDLALKWSTIHYQKPKEKREILSTRLGPFIRFPYMSCQKLREVLTCNDFDHEFATNYVLDALFFKAEAPHHQLINVKEEQTSTNRHFIERAYKYRPVKVVELEHPNPQSVVYLDLKREECAKLFPSGTVFSKAFRLGEHYFSLYAQCEKNQESSFECFGLYLSRMGSGVFDLEFEFSAKSKPTEKYVSKVNSTITFEGRAYGVRNLFSMPWSKFMAKDCVYFIDDVLHLKAELTIKC